VQQPGGGFVVYGQPPPFMLGGNLPHYTLSSQGQAATPVGTGAGAASGGVGSGAAAGDLASRVGAGFVGRPGSRRVAAQQQQQQNQQAMQAAPPAHAHAAGTRGRGGGRGGGGGRRPAGATRVFDLNGREVLVDGSADGGGGGPYIPEDPEVRAAAGLLGVLGKFGGGEGGEGGEDDGAGEEQMVEAATRDLDDEVVLDCLRRSRIKARGGCAPTQYLVGSRPHARDFARAARLLARPCSPSAAPQRLRRRTVQGAAALGAAAPCGLGAALGAARRPEAFLSELKQL
jgi:hypothetical protein